MECSTCYTTKPFVLWSRFQIFFLIFCNHTDHLGVKVPITIQRLTPEDLKTGVMKSNVKLSLSKLTPSALLILFYNVIAKLTGSLVFTAPPKSPAAMKTEADAFKTAIEEAIDGSKAARVHRDTLAAGVRITLNETADYVRMVAKGDRDLLVQSGFELAKDREPIGIPAIPVNVTAIPGLNLGEVIVKWPSVHGAHSYQVLFTDKDPEVFADWTPLTVSTRVRTTAKGLKSLENYWFAVCAIGVSGQSMMSKPALGRAA